MAIKLKQETKIALAIVAVAAILIGLAASAADSTEEQQLTLSTYSTRSGGAKATYSLIGELGYAVVRWTASPRELPEDAHESLFILPGPNRAPNADERSALLRFVGRGGTLLVIANEGTQWIPGLDLRPEIPSKSWYSFGPEAPHATTQNASVISMPKGLYLQSFDRGVALYGESGRCVAAVFRQGKGQVLWLASAVPLSNAGLKAPGNAEFLGSVLAFAGSRHVYWDVYFSQDARHGASAFRFPALLAASAQLLFIFGLILFTHSRRSGPLRIINDGFFPMAQMDFVETLGSLYQSARATNIAVRIAYERFVYLAARRFAASPKDLPTLARHISDATSEAYDAVLAFLEDCDNVQHQDPITKQAALERFQRLQSYAAQVKLISSAGMEKR